MTDGDASAYDARPWAGQYSERVNSLTPPGGTALDMFLTSAMQRPQAPLFYFFETPISFETIDQASSALAAELAANGLRDGDRIAAYCQNDPDLSVAQLAAWKLGAILVCINPMLRQQELEYILSDSGAKALIVLQELYESVASLVVPSTDVQCVILTSPEYWRSGFRSFRRPAAADYDMLAQILKRRAGQTVPKVLIDPQDVACIGYTSGTTGRPKGVRTTHSNLVYNAHIYREWMEIDDADVFVCGTPLFHITGVVAGLALSYLTGTPMILFHRFDPKLFLELTARWRGTFTVMSITAFQALMNAPGFHSANLSSLWKVYSGGAPAPLAVMAEWHAATGHQIRGIYGLTETTSPSHAVPLTADAPVDPASGVPSVGIPVRGARVRVVDPDSAQDVAVGEAGEIWIAGPMVADGYWEDPEGNAASFSGEYLRTGDIGLMDAEGWFYVIDRLKDMINAAGYKVWPREVEDFLYQHPAIREAGVVGIPDSYRGETVKAVVSLKAGVTVTPDELISFCRDRMAAYKYPRVIVILDELPKASSGKILRRELRDAGTTDRIDPRTR